jgi:hypothetical protein
MVSVTTSLPYSVVRWLDRKKGSRAGALRKVLKEVMAREEEA